MKDEIIEQEVTILRPMLGIAKADIVKFADHNNIPHLYDSTPSWSKRGQMRDKLIPGINNFDNSIMPGIADFVKYTSFLEQQWNNSFKMWLDNIVHDNNKIIIKRDLFFDTNFTNLNFWIKLWQTVNWSNRPSNKSFMNIIERISTFNEPIHCELNGYWRAKIKKDLIEIFHKLI
jgi:tRNA(Ile)-lysidine synthase TilS/MesJ